MRGGQPCGPLFGRLLDLLLLRLGVLLPCLLSRLLRPLLLAGLNLWQGLQHHARQGPKRGCGRRLRLRGEGRGGRGRKPGALWERGGSTHCQCCRGNSWTVVTNAVLVGVPWRFQEPRQGEGRGEKKV